jgi:hypothetical protein
LCSELLAVQKRGGWLDRFAHWLGQFWIRQPDWFEVALATRNPPLSR